jgi:hypothetical protein
MIVHKINNFNLVILSCIINLHTFLLYFHNLGLFFRILWMVSRYWVTMGLIVYCVIFLINGLLLLISAYIFSV